MGKPRIMAIDDTQFVCDTLKTWLQGSYEIHTFLSGKEGLAYLTENEVDLILLDYDMPEMTGFEVLMEIRTHLRYGDIPVIFLTGVTNERMEEEMLERGANDYITKPLDIGVLRRGIGKFIK
jgi:CheY-like chemotaxis protein